MKRVPRSEQSSGIFAPSTFSYMLGLALRINGDATSSREESDVHEAKLGGQKGSSNTEIEVCWQEGSED